MHISRRSIPLLAALALSGCASTPSAPINYAHIVGMIQTDYPILVSVLAVVQPGNAKIAAAEALLTPEVAALSSTSAPTSIGAVVTDVAALLPNVPTCAAGASQAACLSTATKSDITLALSLAGAVAGSGFL